MIKAVDLSVGDDRQRSFSEIFLDKMIEKLFYAGVAQLVEHQPSKLRVAGSNPVSRSIVLKQYC